MEIVLPVSLGEALDKLTILDIKFEKISDERRADVQKEYNILKKEYNIIAGHPKVINDTSEELREIMESKAFFYRKFKKTSNIKKYWEKIIRIKDKQKMDYNDDRKLKIMTYEIISSSK
jgi:hypothetical protein